MRMKSIGRFTVIPGKVGIRIVFLKIFKMGVRSQNMNRFPSLGHDVHNDSEFFSGKSMSIKKLVSKEEVVFLILNKRIFFSSISRIDDFRIRQFKFIFESFRTHSDLMVVP